jgi:hypothetical protein
MAKAYILFYDDNGAALMEGPSQNEVFYGKREEAERIQAAFKKHSAFDGWTPAFMLQSVNYPLLSAEKYGTK